MSEQVGLALSCRGLTKVFEKGGRRLEVLSGVDLDLASGGKVAVLGPSGSGKSTLLHILGTLERPSAGELLYDGEPVFTRSGRQLDALRNREVGFVFQFHHLLPDQSALDNVALPLLIRGTRKEQAREEARTLLTEVGLGERLTHLPGELSGGEQQRVSLARALVTRPRLLLADEPTGNLDPRTAGGVFDLMMELNEARGCTLVTVTHSHDLAARFPRRLQVLDGRLQPA